MIRPALTVFLAFLACPAFALEAGSPAPAFVMSDIEGKEQSPAQYKGKVVVLEWNNPGCPFVRKHYDSGNMQALQKEAKEKGVVWLAVNSSASGKQGNLTPDEAKAMLKQEGATPTAYILDADGAIGHLYDAKTTPHMFVIGKEGNIVYEGAIDDKPGFDKQEVAGAHNYVRDAMDAALAGEKPAVASTTAYGCSVKYAD